jgi:3-phosphoshikimate 1-carboxyvinyltransferase
VDPRPIAPLHRPLLDAHVTVPASKSIANRELVLSAQANGRSRLEIGPIDPGDDVHAMYEALAALGHDLSWAGNRIEIKRRETASAHVAIDARDAGTVARFVTALAATTAAAVRIDGSPRMRERPITSLVHALRALGASIDGDRLPLLVRGPLRGGEVSIAGYESSQFASALLLVGAQAAEGLRLRLTGDVVSAPFLDMTVAALEKRGVPVERPTSRSFVVTPHQVKARALVIPGDATAATYPAAAAAILRGSVTVDNVSARHEPGGQGDVRFFDLIEDMGCVVKRGSATTTVRRTGALYGIVANVSDCSDVFPTLAVVATQAETPTELSGLGHTRRQESDRPAVVAAAINALGGRAQAFGDAIRIEPAKLHDGIVDSARDHRIAMAFSILGLQVPGIAIAGSDAVSKTFPGFYEMLEDLRR